MVGGCVRGFSDGGNAIACHECQAWGRSCGGGCCPWAAARGSRCPTPPPQNTHAAALTLSLCPWSPAEAEAAAQAAAAAEAAAAAQAEAEAEAQAEAEVQRYAEWLTDFTFQVLVNAVDTVEAQQAIDSLVGQLGQAALAENSTEGQWAAALATLPSRPQLLAAAQLAAGRVARKRQLQLQLQTTPDGSNDLASALGAAIEVRGRGRGGAGGGRGCCTAGVPHACVQVLAPSLRC